MQAQSAIRLLVIRQRLLFREALAFVLEYQPDFKVTAHVSSLEDAVRISLTTPVDCAILEFDSSQRVDLLCEMLSDLPKNVKVLVIGDIFQIQQLEALRPMVAGFLPNSANCASLVEAVRRIASGHTWRDVPYLDGSAGVGHNIYEPKFTERQQMVLHLVCEGLSTKECAYLLDVSSSSIKCTIQQLFIKTNTRSRSQLIRYTLEHLNHILSAAPRITATAGG